MGLQDFYRPWSVSEKTHLDSFQANHVGYPVAFLFSGCGAVG